MIQVNYKYVQDKYKENLGGNVMVTNYMLPKRIELLDPALSKSRNDSINDYVTALREKSVPITVYAYSNCMSGSVFTHDGWGKDSLVAKKCNYTIVKLFWIDGEFSFNPATQTRRHAEAPNHYFKSLRYCYDRWIYNGALPPYKADGHCPSAGLDTATLADMNTRCHDRYYWQWGNGRYTSTLRDDQYEMSDDR